MSSGFFPALVCYINRVDLSVAVLATQAECAESTTAKRLVPPSFFAGSTAFQIVGGRLAHRYGDRRGLLIAVAWWSVLNMRTRITVHTSLSRAPPGRQAYPGEKMLRLRRSRVTLRAQFVACH